MQCVAVLVSGKPCSRAAEPDLDLCGFHRRIEQRRRDSGFYLDHLSPADRAALAMAAQVEGVDSEIAMLRVLIRKVTDIGHVEAARRNIGTLVRAVKTRHDMGEKATANLTTSLERVLDVLGQEIEAVP